MKLGIGSMSAEASGFSHSQSRLEHKLGWSHQRGAGEAVSMAIETNFHPASLH
jgi:hypothetical protein